MRDKNYTIDEFDEALNKAANFKGGFDRISDPLIVTDEDGTILFANDATLERNDFTLDEVVGKTPGLLWGNQKDPDFYQSMWDTIKTQKKPFYGEMINKRKDGNFYSCDLIIYPILDEAREIEFFVGIESNSVECA